jgi:hypothetical protein
VLVIFPLSQLFWSSHIDIDSKVSTSTLTCHCLPHKNGITKSQNWSIKPPRTLKWSYKTPKVLYLASFWGHLQHWPVQHWIADHLQVSAHQKWVTSGPVHNPNPRECMQVRGPISRKVAPTNFLQSLLQSNKRDVWLQAMLWPWLTTDGWICLFKVRVWIGLSSSSIADPPCPNWTVDANTTQTRCYKQDKFEGNIWCKHPANSSSWKVTSSEIRKHVILLRQKLLCSSPSLNNKMDDGCLSLYLCLLLSFIFTSMRLQWL